MNITKFTDILTVMQNYEQASYSPSRMAVNFGCDCGCGGDSYTEEEWDAEEDAADLAIEKAKELCKILNIEYDGVD